MLWRNFLDKNMEIKQPYCQECGFFTHFSCPILNIYLIQSSDYTFIYHSVRSLCSRKDKTHVVQTHDVANMMLKLQWMACFQNATSMSGTWYF